MGKYEGLFQGIINKWERVTGRHGSFHYTAPETSTTISFVTIMRDLEIRIEALEGERSGD